MSTVSAGGTVTAPGPCSEGMDPQGMSQTLSDVVLGAPLIQTEWCEQQVVSLLAGPYHTEDMELLHHEPPVLQVLEWEPSGM